jgi:outer membrane protein OmpA-like peptidoglycan-associated protein
MKRSLISVAVAAALLTACASTPERVEVLEQARADVQMLSQEPTASEAASRELAAARSSLNAAEQALKEGDLDDVNHYAYLASRQAQTGKARVDERVARQQITQAEAERNRVLLEARTHEAERATSAAQSATAQAQAARAAAESATVTATQRAAEADAARQDALAARAEAADMQKALEELQARPTERGMVLTLSDVLFDTGAATLKPGADLALGRIADFMTANPETRVMIEGHTDSRGSDSYNEDLSRRRAQAVKDALAARNISGDRVEAIGRGEGFPVASNETTAGQQQNRRVEIVFSDKGGRFAQGATTGTMR